MNARPFLARYRPGVDGPFGEAEVAHLLRRGGFGGSARQIQELAKQGLDASLDALFCPDEGAEARALDRAAESLWEFSEIEGLQGLWLLRMLVTESPAAEKLALFWHNHFATSFEKVQSGELMWRQYRLFRRQGMGSFEDLVLRVSRDPAMLIWLDNNSNTRRRPNENYARELMELFTLGVGNYTEADIQQAARAFTGWHVQRGKYWFNERCYDDGVKTVFQESAAFTGDEVVKRCLRQDSAPRFIARKLLRAYVSPTPQPEWVEELSSLLRVHRFVMAPVLRTLLASRLFFSDLARRASIKSPVELCVGTFKALEGRADMKAVARAAAEMGQALFAPPSVKGWDGDRAWISSHTLLVRNRFAAAVALGTDEVKLNIPWEEIVAALPEGGEALVDAVVQAVHQSPLDEGSRRLLVEYEAGGKGQSRDQRVQGLVHLLMTSPDYQLN